MLRGTDWPNGVPGYVRYASAASPGCDHADSEDRGVVPGLNARRPTHRTRATSPSIETREDWQGRSREALDALEMAGPISRVVQKRHVRTFEPDENVLRRGLRQAPVIVIRIHRDIDAVRPVLQSREDIA